MLHRTPLLTALALAALSSAPVAFAAEPPEAIRSITAAYQKEEAAIGRKDLKAVVALYTADYIDIDETGSRSDLADTRKRMLMVFQMVKTIKLQQKLQKFVVKGAQATVTGTAHLEGTLFDPQKHVHRMATDGKFIDIWIKSGKGWLKRQSRSVSSLTTFDGKVQK